MTSNRCAKHGFRLVLNEYGNPVCPECALRSHHYPTERAMQFLFASIAATAYHKAILQKIIHDPQFGTPYALIVARAWQE